MRINENIDDLPFHVLVLAREIPNFTKSLCGTPKIDQRAVKTYVWHVLRVSNGKKPWEPTFEEKMYFWPTLGVRGGLRRDPVMEKISLTHKVNLKYIS